MQLEPNFIENTYLLEITYLLYIIVNKHLFLHYKFNTFCIATTKKKLISKSGLILRDFMPLLNVQDVDNKHFWIEMERISLLMKIKKEKYKIQNISKKC